MTTTTMTDTATPTKLSTPQLAGGAAVVTAMVFLPLHLAATSSIRFALITALCLTAGIAITIIDFREHRIPNRITAPLAAALATVILTDALTRTFTAPHLLTGTTTQGVPLIADALLGAITAGGFFFLIGLAGGTGAGDIKLATIIGGTITPYYGLTTTLLALALAHCVAFPHALVSVIQRRNRSHPRQSKQIAFGPYLVLGAALAVAYIHLTN